MPTFRQLYYSSGVISSNPDLKPEYGWNYEVGYKRELGTEQWKAALFRIQLKDQISSRKDSNGLTQSYNAARYKNTGVELSYQKELNYHVSYTLGGIYNHPEKKDEEKNPWRNTLGRYQISAALQYQNDRTNASLNLSYLGDRVKYKEQSDVGGLLLSNLHVGYDVAKNAAITFDVYNLFNRRDLTDSDNAYYTLGRTFLIGLNYTF